MTTQNGTATEQAPTGAQQQAPSFSDYPQDVQRELIDRMLQQQMASGQGLPTAAQLNQLPPDVRQAVVQRMLELRAEGRLQEQSGHQGPMQGQPHGMPRRESWFRRHKIITGILVTGAILTGLGLFAPYTVFSVAMGFTALAVAGAATVALGVGAYKAGRWVYRSVTGKNRQAREQQQHEREQQDLGHEANGVTEPGVEGTAQQQVNTPEQESPAPAVHHTEQEEAEAARKEEQQGYRVRNNRKISEEDQSHVRRPWAENTGNARTGAKSPSGKPQAKTAFSGERGYYRDILATIEKTDTLREKKMLAHAALLKTREDARKGGEILDYRWALEQITTQRRKDVVDTLAASVLDGYPERRTRSRTPKVAVQAAPARTGAARPSFDGVSAA